MLFSEICACLFQNAAAKEPVHLSKLLGPSSIHYIETQIQV